MSFLNLKNTPSLDFVGRRFWSFGLSGGMILSVFLALLLLGLPYGVDFKGGVIVEMRAPMAPSLDQVRSGLSEFSSGDFSVQTLGVNQDFLLRFEHGLFEGDKEAVLLRMKNVFGAGSHVRRLESVGPKVSAELLRQGLYAVFLALLAMLLYIWFRFEWRYGLAALVALMHDCVGVIGLYALARVEFTETAIVAILITAAYSINDTVVIFDRLRENTGRYGRIPLAKLFNMSVNETLSRTLLTSLTTLVALFVLYLFGGPVIASFSLPIFLGFLIGTYSSICLATPLLYLIMPKGDGGEPLINQNITKGV